MQVPPRLHEFSHGLRKMQVLIRIFRGSWEECRCDGMWYGNGAPNDPRLNCGIQPLQLITLFLHGAWLWWQCIRLILSSSRFWIGGAQILSIPMFFFLFHRSIQGSDERACHSQPPPNYNIPDTAPRVGWASAFAIFIAIYFEAEHKTRHLWCVSNWWNEFIELELRLPRERESDLPMPIKIVDMELLGAVISLGIPLDNMELKASDATTNGVPMVWMFLLRPDMSAKSAAVWSA